MKQKRRDFIKLAGWTGTGLTGTTFLSGFVGANNKNHSKENIHGVDGRKSKQHFNMCGYSADTIPTVRVGFVRL